MHHEYVVCIDADTQLLSDAVSKLMRHFIADKTGRIGAVAGNVKVGNQRNMLTLLAGYWVHYKPEFWPYGIL